MYSHIDLLVGDKLLRGSVRTPEGPGPFPTVCFFHGFSVDKVGLMRLHELFARRCVEDNIACVRFDFYGCGESDGDFHEVRFSSELEQAKAIYDWTSKQSFCLRDSIILAGHSLGGAIASVLAPLLQPKAAVLWSPGNTAYYDISDRVHAVPGQYQSTYDIGGLALSGEFLTDLRSHDIVELSKGYNGPVLLVHGECDEKIPIASIGPYLDVYQDNIQTYIVKGSNHQYSSLRWKQEVYDVSMKFITTVVKR